MGFGANGWFLSSLMAATVLAGCAGTDDGEEQDEEIVSEDLGAIEGRVLDDEDIGVTAVQVALRGSDELYATNGLGEFLIPYVAPGEHIVDVAKIGFQSQSVPVRVDPEQVATLTIRLTPQAVPEATYYETTTFTGYYECALGAGVWVSACSYPYTAVYLGLRDGACPQPPACTPPLVNLSNYGFQPDIQRNEFRYNFTVEPNATQVVSEMAWSPNTVISKNMQLIISCPDYDPVADDCNGPTYARTNGQTPVRVVWNASQVRDPPQWVMARGYLPFTIPQVAFNQRFDMWNTVFYHGPAPEDFSILDEAG